MDTGYTRQDQGNTKRGEAAETVQQKALRLYRAGQVRHIAGDRYEVVGDHGTYEVNDHKQLCECPSQVYCSHRAAVVIVSAKQNTAAMRKLEEKRREARSRKNDRTAFSNEQIEAMLARMEG